MAEMKLVTERQATERERVAYRWGWNDATSDRELPHSRQAQREKEMADMYPLPKVTRARVLREDSDQGVSYRCVGGVIQCYWHDALSAGWKTMTNIAATKERVALWADLLANPTEEVEAGEDDDSWAASPEGR